MDDRTNEVIKWTKNLLGKGDWLKCCNKPMSILHVEEKPLNVVFICEFCGRQYESKKKKENRNVIKWT
jgi:hypothetical protein